MRGFFMGIKVSDSLYIHAIAPAKLAQTEAIENLVCRLDIGMCE